RGFQPQTNESLKILESRKVPFVVALNKVDMISGWQQTDDAYISQAIKKQSPSIQTNIDEQIYNVVGALSILGYQSEAFYRVQDFKKEISIVPVSARSGVGIPELLAVLVGLTQQFLSKKLEQEEKQTRGIVLEVNDEVGLGPTANMILIDGHLQKDDNIVVAKRDSVIITKPKALLLPKPLDEMRDPRDKFKPIDEVQAAAGIKIASPDLDGVLPGTTVYASPKQEIAEEFKKTLESEMESVFIDTETTGLILKCDTIGSLEAITEMLRRQQIPIAKADIGPVTRRDVMQAKAIKDKDRHLGVILAFNVKVFDDAKTECDESHIRVFEDKVIYSLIDTYSQWVDDDKSDLENSIFKEFTPISKFTFLKGYTFRNNNPAVFGIRVDIGTLRQKIAFTNKNGKKIGNIHSLEADGKTVQEVKTGEEVACSVQNVTIGRQINEEDVFYTLPTPSEAKQLLKKYAHKLSSEELQTLNEIVSIQRETNPVYGY
ncbi:MAG: translation initiation factor IF-2, partial [Thermoproteota archaeon]|nr:translation initiation factor IF-2 [Thermoproteota archaeon]